MNLYKISLDRNHPSVRQGFVDRQDLHINIQQFFDGCREETKVLYRVHGSDIYVSAKTQPICNEKNGMRIQTSKEMPEHGKGDQCRFNVLTQPYIKRQGKRIPLIREKERMDWLIKQGDKHGFRILMAREMGNASIRSHKKLFDLKAYYYFGVLEVTDKVAFREALENGIGASKAYGLGMLMVV